MPELGGSAVLDPRITRECLGYRVFFDSGIISPYSGLATWGQSGYSIRIVSNSMTPLGRKA